MGGGWDKLSEIKKQTLKIPNHYTVKLVNV
jgi:hypothetical protein